MSKKQKFSDKINSQLLKCSYEYRVLATLKFLYPDMYNNMEKGESPDLQDKDNNIGIEVTTLSNNKELAASDAYYKLIRYKNISQQIKIINKNNHSLTITDDGIIHMLSFGSYFCDKELFIKVINNKLDKLNEYKNKYKVVGLAVLIVDIICSETEYNIVNIINELYQETNNFYDFIYVISSDFCIYYNVYENVFKKRILSEEENLNLKKIGRMTAENVSNIETDEKWK